MTIWKTAALGAALAAAAGVGAAITPVVQGQTRVVRTQTPRALEIITGGSRIGVSIRDLEDADGAPTKGVTAGVIVEDVTAESAAEKAGIRKGDAIVEFDGERVRSARQLTRLVQETPAGRTVQAAIVREGQRSTVSITPREGSGFGFDRLDDLANFGDFRYKVAPVPPRPPAAPKAPAPPSPPSPPSVWNFDELVGRSTNRLGISVSSLSSAARRVLRDERGRARLLGHRRLRRRQSRRQSRRRHHQRQRHVGERSVGRPPPGIGSRPTGTSSPSR